MAALCAKARPVPPRPVLGSFTGGTGVAGGAPEVAVALGADVLVVITGSAVRVAVGAAVVAVAVGSTGHVF
jgi:hypothetical protein